MKRFFNIILLIGIFLLTNNIAVCAGGYDGKEIILSWTEDNAHTQTVTWCSQLGKEGYLQYNEAGRKLSSERQVKAKLRKIARKGKIYHRYEGRITGLRQGTKYDYRVGDGSAWSKSKSFMTAPAAAESGIIRADEAGAFKFLYIGDIQYKVRDTDYKTWGAWITKAKKRHPEIAFGVTGGDMVNDGDSLKEWSLFFQNAGPVFSQIPLMTAVGNHEGAQGADVYRNMVAMPENSPENGEESFYSFDYGDCHFVLLDTTFFMDAAKQRIGAEWEVRRDVINSWLTEDLNGSEAKWKIAVMHHPAYGISDGDSIYHEIRENWESTFQRGGVDLVFCGHQHIYMRTKAIKGITYVMGNAGEKRSTYYDGENFPDYGAALDATNSNYQVVQVSRDQLTMTAYEEEGQVIDKWTKKDSRLTIGEGLATVLTVFLLLGLMLARIFWLRRDT